MKSAGLASYATIVTLIALGSIALAAPSFQAALQAPEPLAATGPSATTGPDAETGPGREIESPAPFAPQEGDGEGASPDFAVCEGLTGLDNAICRHEALLAVHPDHEGLQNALARLEANRERHEAKQASKEDDSQSSHGGGNHDGSGGRGHGNGNGHGNANGHGG